jgi:hypothetical protein
MTDKISKSFVKVSFMILYLVLPALIPLASFDAFKIVAAQPLPPAPQSFIQNGNENNSSNATAAFFMGNLSNTPSPLIYTNPENGIVMLYPYEWRASIAGLSYPEIVSFYAPLQNLSDFLPARVGLSVTDYVQIYPCQNSVTLHLLD